METTSQSLTPDIQQALGFLRVENDFSMIETVRAGISEQIFGEIVAASPFTLEDWQSFLHAPEGTLSAGFASVSPLQSDLILQIATLIQKGVEVFGSVEKFSKWANRSNPLLQGQRPKDLLDTTFGINLVRNEIGRIEHGILA